MFRKLLLANLEHANLPQTTQGNQRDGIRRQVMRDGCGLVIDSISEVKPKKVYDQYLLHFQPPVVSMGA